MAGALAVFTQVHGIWIVALAFAIPYGWANGIMTIVRGTVPAELFGHRGYGALLGRLALPQFVLKAVAPFARISSQKREALNFRAITSVAPAVRTALQHTVSALLW